MIDLNQFTTIAELAVLIGVIVQAYKLIRKPPDTEKDSLPIVAIVAGLILAPLFGWVLGKIQTNEDFVSFVVGGFLAGVSSVGGYEATVDKLKNLLR